MDVVILYAYDRFGYTVKAYDMDSGNIVDEYEAGNYTLESTAIVDTCYSRRGWLVPTKQLGQWAREMAKEWRLTQKSKHRIYKDPDIRSELRYMIEYGGL